MAANPYSVQTADLSGIMTGLGSVLESTRKRKAQEQSQNDLMQAYRSGSPDQVAAIIAKSPEAGKQLEQMMGFRNKETKQNFLETTRKSLADPDNALQYMQDRVEFVQSIGGDPSDTIKAMKMEQSAVTPEDKDKLKNYREMVYAQLASPQEFKAYQQQQKEGETSQLKIGSQEILEDGTIIQSTNSGPVVYNPQGKRVKGQAAADAVSTARAAKVSNSRRAAGGRRKAALEAELELKGKVEAGIVSQKGAATISVKAFDKLEKINLNISNMDEAIKAIDEGASTGIIQSKLPSIRAASQRLDNLQRRLGLDVVGQTTFGALSKGELDLALKVAIPLNLNSQELKKWLIEKKAAMEKLSDYVEASAIYLGTPGNTVKGWIEYQRGKQTTQQQPDQQQFKEGMTATNPQTGQKMVFQNGQWQ